MIIGIDISQVVFKGTGVGRYVEEMVRELLKTDKKNEYILFGTSLRQQKVLQEFFFSIPEQDREKTRLKILPLPPTIVEFLWNRLHIFPIEWFIGSVNIFWSSDWTQPPLLKAKGVTTIHDLTIFRFPESFPKEIVAVHTRKLKRSRDECSFFFCDSEATKKDAHSMLNIPLEHLNVVYPGYNL